MARRGTFQMLIMDGTIVTIGRKWRSKWLKIQCVGCRGRRRKDGTCKHERAVFAMVSPELQSRTRIVRQPTKGGA